jgi:hypothetical protein
MIEKTDKQDKEHLEELKEMVQGRKKKEPVEKVLTMFCHRHGIAMDQCKKYYDQLVATGEIEEK